MTRPKVLLVGRFGPGALERSYAAAFEEIGCETHRFDIASVERRYCRLGAVGHFFNRFVRVEPWTRKANREMVLAARSLTPEAVVVFGQNRALPGALAQIRAMITASLAFVWPDPLVNMDTFIIAGLPLYDWVGTYSRSTVPVFERLGARRAGWLPLAADPHMHPVSSPRPGFACDVGFIGQWRPERERAVQALLNNVPGLKLKLWGPDWGRRSRHPGVLQAWQKCSLFAADFAQAVSSATLNLNVIDDTNYPAANMRFFEIPGIGGAQVCSACPEWAEEYRHGEMIFYYRSLDELPRLVQELLADQRRLDAVARAAHNKTRSEHTYAHRAREVLRQLGLEKGGCRK